MVKAVSESVKHMATAKEANRPLFQLSLGAVFAALVCVVTVLFTIPIPATSGYFNLGESVIFIAALIFEPFVGSIAGGGAAIADLILGAYVFAPATLIIKTFEGLIVGITNRKLRQRTSSATLSATISIVLGGVEMIAGYFIYETLVKGYPAALTEIPVNIVQVVVGLAVAVPIMHAIFRVFPQLKS